MRRHDNLERDRAIIRAVQGGMSMRAIARQLGLSVGAIHRIVHRVAGKVSLQVTRATLWFPPETG